MVIDPHAHIVSEPFINKVRAGKFGPSLSIEQGKPWELLITRYKERGQERIHRNPLPRETYDVDLRLEHMDAMGVDRQILSVVPPCTYYGVDPELGLEISRDFNDSLSALTQKYPHRFSCMATVPLQNPPAAATELERAVKAGHVGVEIGTNVSGRNLDDPSLTVFWDKVALLDVPVFIHPTTVLGINDRLKDYYLANFIGNPLETTIAAAALIFGGIMERHPGLKILLAHMGGYVPWIRGRWEHGYEVRGEPKKNCTGSPENPIKRFYYDTIIHNADCFEFGVKTLGIDQIIYGTDYPFDMGYLGPAKEIPGLSLLSPEDREKIFSTTALGIFSKLIS
jgi:aminocarboxymuconate-semialdehyde decarboxylase